MTTPFQLKWLFQLLGFDYEIQYKKGSENVVVDALSRVNQGAKLLQMAVSYVESSVWIEVKDSWKNDVDARLLIQSLKDKTYKGNKYSWDTDVLKRKGKILVGEDEELRKQLISHYHNEAMVVFLVFM